MVLKEIILVEEEDTIYKLVGPILVKTELDEAKMNLEKRIGFIKDEM
jgi:prefoldin beta subunit